MTIGRVSEGPERGLRVHSDAWIGGNTGIGTITPIVPLHVRRSDNSAQVLVEDTGSGSPQALFKLENNGFPLFQMTDSSQANVDWAFRLAGTQDANERFEITKIGTGGSEMALFHNGDVEIQGSLFQGSSREIKDEITEMDPETVLSRIDRLSIHEWSYKRQGGGRHVGPMAEDFHSLFGLGRGDKTISPSDLAGVALAAAKALQADRSELRREFLRRSEALAEENAELQRQNDELRQRLERVESMLASD